MSDVKADVNSQQMVSYLRTIQTMALSVTVIEIFNIFICMGNTILTPNFWGFGVEHPQIVTGKTFSP